jgi:cystine transport system substrate-binding protein
VLRPVTLRVAVPALAAGSILVSLVPAASGSGSGNPASRADSLRAENDRLAGRSRSVVLELYGLDSQLDSARSRLAEVQARAAEVRGRRAEAGQALQIARHAARVSERALGSRLRTLYEEGDTDGLAVLLGSQSLDEAIAQLDDLQTIAEQDQAVIDQTRSTAVRMKRLRHTLAARQTELAGLEADASAAVARLEAAHAQRQSYLASLAAERSLNAGRISSLQAQAQAAQRTTQTLVAASSATAPTVIASPPVAAPQGARTLTVVATGYSLGGHTATGVPVGAGVVAVDPSVIALGTRMTIPGYGEGVAADVGVGVRGASIDLWFPTTAQALAWGRRSVTVTLH